MPLRIAFTVHKFPPESLGGTEVYAWTLARALARMGHSIHVFYPMAGLPEGERQITREGAHLWRAPVPSASAPGNPATQYWRTFRDGGIEASFASFLGETQPDIVHFQHVQGVSARLIALAAPLPRVLTLHDYWYFCANSQLIRPDRTICAGPKGGWNCVDCATTRADLQRLRALRPLVALPFAYRNAYLARQLRGIRAFVAPSRFLADQYARRGLVKERIHVLENGVDFERLGAGTTAFPPPRKRPHFAFLGSLAWQKGAHVLIEAFNQIAGDASLTIFGSESTFPEYAAELRARARHPDIRFAGAIHPNDVGAALRTVDCLVVPSLWYENSPLVIQEAFAMNVPVLASRLGALEEKVQDRVTGRLFAAGNSADLRRVIESVIDQPEQLSQYRANIRPAISIDEHAQALELIYREVLQSVPR